MSTPPPVEYPTREELIALLAHYVDVDMGSPSADPGYVTECADESIEWLAGTIADTDVVPPKAYTRAFLEGGAQLFRRRRSWAGVDQLDPGEAPPVYANPFRPAFIILAPYIGPVIA